MTDVPRFLGWNMTKLEDHDQCPFMARFKHLEKVCTKCWKGRLAGHDPRVCDACGEEEFKPAPFVRGGAIGNAVNRYLLGKAKKPPNEIRNEKVKESMAEAKKLVAAGDGKVEHQIVLDDGWKPVSQYTKDAWFRGKLDVLVKRAKDKLLRVIDWKTGNIDKRTGGPDLRKKHKYDHQLVIYNVAAMSAYPEAAKATASLVFLDAGPRFDPVHAKPALDITRNGLRRAQAALRERVKPLLSDKTFAPRPGYYCGYCPYAKDRGGPCKFESGRGEKA
jgi:hypothetical protein